MTSLERSLLRRRSPPPDGDAVDPEGANGFGHGHFISAWRYDLRHKPPWVENKTRPSRVGAPARAVSYTPPTYCRAQRWATGFLHFSVALYQRNTILTLRYRSVIWRAAGVPCHALPWDV